MPSNDGFGRHVLKIDYCVIACDGGSRGSMFRGSLSNGFTLGRRQGHISFAMRLTLT